MNGDSGRLFCNKLERRQRNWQRRKYQKQPQTPNHYKTNFGMITLRQRRVPTAWAVYQYQYFRKIEKKAQEELDDSIREMGDVAGSMEIYKGATNDDRREAQTRLGIIHDYLDILDKIRRQAL